MAKKTAVSKIKLQIPAGKAKPRPACRPGLGPARGQHYGFLQAV